MKTILADLVPDAHAVCCDNVEHARSLASGSVQLVVTSPPYNLGKRYESTVPMDAYLSGFDRILDECARILTPTGSLCWQVGNHVDHGEITPLDILFWPLFKNRGFVLRNRVIWHFGHGLHCSKRLSGRHETILWFTRPGNYMFHLDPIRVPQKYPGKKYFKGPRIGQLSCNPLGKNPGDVWIFPNVKENHVEKTAHPCQFPVELAERLVLALSDEGDAVYDPFMGAGSTLVAAWKHGRRGIGCDTVEAYAEIAQKRLADLRDGVLRTRPMGRPVHDPD